MAPGNPDMKRMAAVQEKYSDTLMSYPNVVGIGIGKRPRGGEYVDELCLVVLVSMKLPTEQLQSADILPAKVDGVPIDVIETGAFVV